MARETISFIVFFVLLAVAFRLGGSDWRTYQQDYRAGAHELTRRNWEQRVVRAEGLVPVDSLPAWIERLDIAGRLERAADSLTALRAELDGYEDLLLAARDALAGRESDSDGASDKYFRSVEAYRKLEEIAASLEGEADTMRMELETATVLAGGAGISGQSRINWLTPAVIPVREACTTCHLPLDGKSEVMLYPDSGHSVDYPEVMSSHDYRKFGCTVCHAGEAGALEFRSAHGPDHMLRPFRPGKLALRACGICHAGMSPLTNGKVAFSWPAACAACHQADSLPALADSSGNPALQAPLAENSMRSWLLRHWADKSGVLPDREEFEPVLAILISGDVRRMPVQQVQSGQADSVPKQEQTVRDSLPDGGKATCPSCGRTFAVNLGGRQAVCPLDGTPLVVPRRDK